MLNHHPASSSTRLSRRPFLYTGLAGITTPPLLHSNAQTSGPSGAPVSPEDSAWAEARAAFDIEPGLIYLNNASLGMPPAVVAEAACQGYHAMSRNPTMGKTELYGIIKERLRPDLSRFLGIAEEELFLTHNATESLHYVATGLALEPGDEAVITTQEHPAGNRPWQFLAARRGITVREVFMPSPLDRADQVAQRFADHLTDRTRVIAFCHVTRGGHVYPVKQLTALARERGITTIVDGAQAVGMMATDLHDLGCDAYATSLHKWMLAPIGTGMLYVRKEAQARIRSIYEGEPGPGDPGYEAPGTTGLPAKAGAAAAVSFIEGIGIRGIEMRNRYLSDGLKARLAEMPRIRLVSGTLPGSSAPGSTIFEIDGMDAPGLVSVLREQANIHVDDHTRDNHRAIRVSTHFYNTTDEIDRFATALQAHI